MIVNVYMKHILDRYSSLNMGKLIDIILRPRVDRIGKDEQRDD